MSAIDARQKELEDIEVKLDNARKAAAARGATEKDKADLKLIEQEYLAAKGKARRAETGSASAGKAGDHSSDPKKKLDKKLDEALKGSFPGSDPVSFVEAAPVKEQDRGLPDVKVADQQQPRKTQAAKETAKGAGKKSH